MFYFETDVLREDLKAWLADAGIPVRTYQRLELLFRQVLTRSSCVEADFSHHEPVIDLSNTNWVNAIDDALEAWQKRYPDREYGFEKLSYSAKSGRAKARTVYRQALLKFGEVFSSLPSPDLEDEWLNELARSLRFHQSTEVPTSPLPEMAYYIGLAEGFFRPFFEAHFNNRRFTSERFYEFLAIKMMVEAGGPRAIPKMKAAELRGIARDVGRMQDLPRNWQDRILNTEPQIRAA